MSPKDISKALMRKASHLLKEAKNLSTSASIKKSANYYFQAMLVAAEAILASQDIRLTDPQAIIKSLSNFQLNGEVFPSEAISWLEEIYAMVEGEKSENEMDIDTLEDIEDKANKFLVTVENLLFEII